MTAANSSSISDGAAALVLMRRSTAEKRGLQPLADDRRATRRTRRSPAVHDRAGRRDPQAATRRPAGDAKDVDLFEINEAFAVVTHGRNARARHLPHETRQRARRRVRARPSDRRVRARASW